MSFPRYPTYTASGVEWLGDVPGHWDVVQFKQFVDIQNGADHKHVEQAEGYPVLGSGGVFAHASSFLYDGESVLLGRKGTIDKPLHVTGRFWTVDTMYWTVIHPNTCGRFAYYAALTIPFDYYTTNTALPSMTKGALHSHLVARPPLDEQERIAAFLDCETAKIDALVAEQERLIELLKEKRQAVISHAVTKGLSPDAPMKPSGIEWLGEVPAHWRTLSLKRLAGMGAATFTDGDWIEAPYITTEGVRLIQTGNVGIGYFKEQGFRYVSEETFEVLKCTEVSPGDVLICRLDGPVGRACLAPDLGVRMITSVDNTILKVAEDVVPEFVVGLFSSMPWIAWIDALCRVGGGFRLRVSRSQLGELRVPVPPFEEQLAIVRRIEAETAAWDQLVAQSQRAIDLLQERRRALISAAVTGMIDVRGLVNTEVA